jgi:hypothetical protein
MVWGIQHNVVQIAAAVPTTSAKDGDIDFHLFVKIISPALAGWSRSNINA